MAARGRPLDPRYLSAVTYLSRAAFFSRKAKPFFCNGVSGPVLSERGYPLSGARFIKGQVFFKGLLRDRISAIKRLLMHR